MEAVLEIGYFGRKEAIEAMMKEGVVEKLVQLQRLEVGDDDLGIRVGGKGERLRQWEKMKEL